MANLGVAIKPPSLISGMKGTSPTDGRTGETQARQAGSLDSVPLQIVISKLISTVRKQSGHPMNTDSLLYSELEEEEAPSKVLTVSHR